MTNHRIRFALAITLASGLLLAGCSSGDGFTVDPAVQAGVNPYVYSWSADNESATVDRDYLLYAPDEYLDDPGEPWPLVLYLHGSGETISLDESAANGLPALVKSIPYRFLMVAPYATEADWHDGAWASGEWAGYLADLISHVGTQVSVDSDRIYVTGHSLGGNGAWALESAMPSLPGAVMTFAGYWDLCRGCGWPEDWSDWYPDNVCEMADTPTWIFHSLHDFVVDQEASQVMVDQLEACGSDVRHTWYDDGEHNIVGRAFADLETVDWMLSQGYEGDWPALPDDW